MTDIYYIARKTFADAEAREALRKLFHIFTVVDVCGEDCEKALDMDMEDYEDAVAVVCGRKAGVDCIITRDEGFLRANDSKVRILTPAAFLEQF